MPHTQPTKKPPSLGAFHVLLLFSLLGPDFVLLPLYFKGHMLQGNHHFHIVTAKPVHFGYPLQAYQFQGQGCPVCVPIFPVVNVCKLPSLIYGFCIPLKWGLWPWALIAWWG